MQKNQKIIVFAGSVLLCLVGFHLLDEKNNRSEDLSKVVEMNEEDASKSTDGKNEAIEDPHEKKRTRKKKMKNRADDKRSKKQTPWQRDFTTGRVVFARVLEGYGEYEWAAVQSIEEDGTFNLKWLSKEGNASNVHRNDIKDLHVKPRKLKLLKKAVGELDEAKCIKLGKDLSKPGDRHTEWGYVLNEGGWARCAKLVLYRVTFNYDDEVYEEIEKETPNELRKQIWITSDKLVHDLADVIAEDVTRIRKSPAKNTQIYLSYDKKVWETDEDDASLRTWFSASKLQPVVKVQYTKEPMEQAKDMHQQFKDTMQKTKAVEPLLNAAGISPTQLLGKVLGGQQNGTSRIFCVMSVVIAASILLAVAASRWYTRTLLRKGHYFPEEVQFRAHKEIFLK